MKKKYLILFVAIFFFTNSKAQDSSSYYYYYRGEKQTLYLNPEKKYVLFDTRPEISDIRNSFRLNIPNIREIQKLKIPKTIWPYGEQRSRDLYWSIITGNENLADKAIENSIYEAPFFFADKGRKYELGLSQYFYVKLEDENDLDLLKELAVKTKVEIIGNNKFMPLWYTLACDKHSTGNALEMANFFFESGYFVEAQPDLMENILKYSVNNPPVDDPFFTDQWNLLNTGQFNGDQGNDIDATNAWEITKGVEEVIVAVLDHGIELDHPDLVNNIHAVSFDTETGTSPSQVHGNHGTAVSGIIAAEHNSIGISGISPLVTLMSISNNLKLEPNAPQKLADGINFAWQNGAAIINNSWGHNSLQSSFIDNAIFNAVTYGRDGLGTVLIFATGNDNDNSLGYPSGNLNVISVGAMNMCSQRKTPNSCDGEDWWGSNYGNGLDVVAPGVKIFTTDRQGVGGYNRISGVAGNYYSSFNGTSSAAPHVSAIAALILSVNPQLTYQEVQDIIERTTDQIGNYNYVPGSGENGSLPWNIQMGYGRVNALRAVEKAILSKVVIMGPESICNTETYTLDNLLPGMNVNWEASGSITIPQNSTGNSVTVTINDNGNGELKAIISSQFGNSTLPR